MNKEELRNIIGTLEYRVSEVYKHFITTALPNGHKQNINGADFEIIETQCLRDASSSSYDEIEEGDVIKIFKVGDKFYKEIGRFDSYGNWNFPNIGNPIEVKSITKTFITTTWEEI